MRIVWLANAPWSSSGYGQQTAIFARRLRALGHDVAIACNYGLQQMITTWDGFTVYPAQDGDWGDQTIETYARLHEADAVIALCDAWVLHPDLWPELNMAIWAPVDHYPIPPLVLGTLAKPNVQPIAMSRFGEKQMRDCQRDVCLECNLPECDHTGPRRRLPVDPLYVPHGYDPAVFKPMPELRDTIRDHLGVPRDAFLAGMVAANKSAVVHRKSFPQAFHAFRNLQRSHPDSYLYVHAPARPVGAMDLVKLHKMLGIPDDRIMFPSDEAYRIGIGPDVVAKLYAAFDVLLMPSMGEGFGVPLIEAQACSCPVITSRHSAMTELAEAGWLVDGDPWWDAPAESFFFVPLIQSITDRLEEAYEARGDQRWRDAAVEFARPYDADLVTLDYWEPVLERLAPKAEPESRQVRRARERREAKQRDKVAA